MLGLKDSVCLSRSATVDVLFYYFLQEDGNCMLLHEYEANQPTLLAFCEVAADQLIITKGDVTESLPLEDICETMFYTSLYKVGTKVSIFR